MDAERREQMTLEAIRDGFLGLLALQHKLQRDGAGNDFIRLGHSGPGTVIAEAVRWNVLALENELHEFLNEVQWKPWRPDQGNINRSFAIGELVDALHFFLNLCLLVLVDEALGERVC